MFKLDKNKIAYKGSILRENLYLSLEELSKKTGLDSNLLSEFEHNKAFPTMSEMIKLCKFFNVSASFLMGTNNIRGEFNDIPEEFEFQKHLDELANSQGINLASFTDNLLNIKKVNVKRAFSRNSTMVFKNLYMLAIALDVSLDYLIGSTPFRNWIDWAKEYHVNYYKELEQANQAFTERAYYEKNIQNLVEDTPNEKRPYRIKELMQEHNKSIEFYLELVGTSEGTFRHWLNGSGLSDAVQMVKLAEYFQVNCAYLLGLSDIRTSNFTYNISVNLLEKLNELNVSIAEFKSRLHMQSVTFKKYSAENPPTFLKTYVAIAEALDVSIDYILGLTPYKNWETDYVRAVSPHLWMHKGTALCVIDSKTHEKLYNLFCIDSKHLKCVNQDMEIITLDEEFIQDKEFIQMLPLIAETPLL